MLKKAVKYQSNQMKKSIIIYYGIMFLIYSVLFLTVFTHVGGASIAGVEVSTAIFIFILALNSFTDNFKMALQNGVSRNTLFYAYVINVIGASIIMSLVSNVTSVILKGFIQYDPMFLQIYGGKYLADSGSILKFIDGFLWTAFFYMLAAMLGYFITTFYYRMNKTLKIVVSVGVPVFFLAGIPFIEYNWTNGAIAQGTSKVMSYLLVGPNGNNPYYFIATGIVVLMILGALSYGLVRKAVVKIF